MRCSRRRLEVDAGIGEWVGVADEALGDDVIVAGAGEDESGRVEEGLDGDRRALKEGHLHAERHDGRRGWLEAAAPSSRARCTRSTVADTPPRPRPRRRLGWVATDLALPVKAVPGACILLPVPCILAAVLIASSCGAPCGEVDG